MSKAELIADLRRRADAWLAENDTDTQDYMLPGEKRRYWRGYAHGLRAAADAIELNLQHT